MVLVRYSCFTDEQSGPDSAGGENEILSINGGKKSVTILAQGFKMCAAKYELTL